VFCYQMSVPVSYCYQTSCVVDLHLFSHSYMTDSYKHLPNSIHQMSLTIYIVTY